jgi:hypothetical protein
LAVFGLKFGHRGEKMKQLQIIVFVGLASILTACSKFSVDMVDWSNDKTNHWAAQGWSDTDRRWYHHAAQGTNTFGMPVEWFKALEQPSISLSESGLFSDQDYLARFGFIKSPASVNGDSKHGAIAGSYRDPARKQGEVMPGNDPNAWNLPVGFAVGAAWFDPATKKNLPLPGTGKNATSFGLTCAGCHTGVFEYKNHRVFIDGGPAMISLDNFRKALGLSLAATKYVPYRFDRFARRVLGTAHSETNHALLKKQFDAIFTKAKEQNEIEEDVSKQHGTLVEGFGRLDALNRIGNEVFAAQMGLPENMHGIMAPVSFPFIWNAPWFDWVQYNSSIQQPMVRNLGEAMGVKGKVNLTDPYNPFVTDIPMEDLHKIERLLAGEKRPWETKKFGGLQSPKWVDLAAQDILPALDQKLVDQGRKLYLAGDPIKKDKHGLCVGCHLPPLDSEAIFLPQYWQKPVSTTDKEFLALKKQLGSDERFLALNPVPVMEIGTDCRAAYDMAYRTVSTPDFIGNSGALVPPFKPGEIPKDCPQPSSAAEKLSPFFKSKPGFVITNFGVALGEVVGKVKLRAFDDEARSAEERFKLNGYRPNGIRATVSSDYYPTHCKKADGRNPEGESKKDCWNPALPSYRARPLNGAWATAPFLHNGSVPNLYLLLGSQEEREQQAAKFYAGGREFDPALVGNAFRAEKGPPLKCANLPGVALLKNTKGLFELDTNIPGNRNTGHLFADDKPAGADGRIGRALACDERLAIIEFLKSL